MTESENTSKTQADFYRALGEAADRMPMPFQVYFEIGGGVQLRYRTVEDVDAALAHIGGRAVHDSHVHDTGHLWHAYGNKYGDALVSYWADHRVEVWAAIDGPPPEVES